MRIVRWCLMAIGAIGILFVIALVVGYCLFCLVPPIKADMMQIVVTAAAAQSLDQKVDAFKAEIDDAVETGENREITLTITNEEVNSKLTEIVAEGKLPLEQALVNFGDGYFMAYAVIDVPGVAAKTGMRGQIELTDGGPEVVVEDFDLGKLPLPEGMNDRVGGLMNILVLMELPTDELPLEVTAVEFIWGELTVKGVTKVSS